MSYSIIPRALSLLSYQKPSQVGVTREEKNWEGEGRHSFASYVADKYTGYYTEEEGRILLSGSDYKQLRNGISHILKHLAN